MRNTIYAYLMLVLMFTKPLTASTEINVDFKIPPKPSDEEVVKAMRADLMDMMQEIERIELEKSVLMQELARVAREKEQFDARLDDLLRRLRFFSSPEIRTH